MAVVQLTVEGYRCERCQHIWIPRQSRNAPTPKGQALAKPRLCPRCKSAWWDTPPLKK